MAQDEPGGFARRKPEEREARLHADAAQMLTARSIVRNALPLGYRLGPVTDMLLWLYLHPDDTEVRLYRATDLSRSPSSATRWLTLLLKDGMAARNAKGLSLTDEGVALLEAALDELSSMDCFPILQ